MEKSKLIIAFEREKINSDIGSDSEKFAFAETYPNVARFTRTHSQFYATGLFQLHSGPPILILPWFMKTLDHRKLLKSHSQPKFLSIIQNLKLLADIGVELSTKNNGATAADMILYSHLIKLQLITDQIIIKNHQREQKEEIKTIMGKWDIAKDLLKGARPLNFTCTYNSIDKNSPILIFIKSLLNHFSRNSNARVNMLLMDRILKNLFEVESHILQPAIIANVKRSIFETRSDPDDLMATIEFAESIYLGTNVRRKNAGLAYVIEMDTFFEDLTKRFLSLSNNVVSSQQREDLMGGAVWQSQGSSNVDGPEEKKAIQKSIPDLIVRGNKFVLILECKYKPFRIPYINDQDKSDGLKSFAREDRNQILSFILSVRPSFELRNKSLHFAIIFPCTTVEQFKTTTLNFESTKMIMDPLVRNISQNKLKQNNDDGLKIKFVGINVNSMIDSVLTRNQALSANLIENITSSSSSNGPNNIVNLAEFRQRQLLMAALAVESATNSRVLGQVKLAKILYLADSHLNLNLNGDYERRPFGPLDHKMIYDSKLGLNAIGNKFAIFKFIKTPTVGKYIPSENLTDATKKARATFADKITNIEWLLSVTMPLSSDDAEIISTLYACWNDLLLDFPNVSSNQIIEDFLENWHPSKLRHPRQKLERAIIWMKKNELIPKGTFRKTKAAAGDSEF